MSLSEKVTGHRIMKDFYLKLKMNMKFLRFKLKNSCKIVQLLLLLTADDTIVMICDRIVKKSKLIVRRL